MAKLKSIAFENFRAFEKEVIIEIAPITILVGPNGSGKSSVLKIIELLKANLERFTLNELRIDLKELELHTYENVINKNGTSSEMSIAITIAFDSKELFYYLFGEKVTYKLNYKSLKQELNKFKLQEVQLTDGSEVFFELAVKKNFPSYNSTLNTDLFLKKLNSVFDDEFFELLEFICKNDYSLEEDDENHELLVSLDLIEDKFGRGEFGLNGKGISLSNKMAAILSFAESLKISDDRKTFSQMSKEDLKKHFKLSLTSLSINNWKDLSILLLLRKPDINNRIDKEIFSILLNFFSNSTDDFYLNAKRKGIDLEKMIGDLFSIMLNHITSFFKIDSNLKQKRFYPFEDFIKDSHESYLKVYDKEYRLSEEQTKLFDIGDQLVFKNIEGIGVLIKVIKGSTEFDLCDIGFGYTRLLPILFQLTTMKKERESYFKNTYFILEEPESNLHPSLQSKLADFFSSIISNEIANDKGRIGFLVETHSEYLIRKLQYLTAKGELKTNDTVIHYFYPPDQIPIGENQVKKINIEKDGSLTDDFGTGFFDEADKIALEIFLLHKSQKN